MFLGFQSFKFAVRKLWIAHLFNNYKCFVSLFPLFYFWYLYPVHSGHHQNFFSLIHSGFFSLPTYLLLSLLFLFLSPPPSPVPAGLVILLGKFDLMVFPRSRFFISNSLFMSPFSKDYRLENMYFVAVVAFHNSILTGSGDMNVIRDVIGWLGKKII